MFKTKQKIFEEHPEFHKDEVHEKKNNQRKLWPVGHQKVKKYFFVKVAP